MVSKVWAFCLGTRRSARQTTNMTSPRTREFAARSELTPPRTFVLPMDKITGLVMFTSFTLTDVLGLSRSGPIRQPRCETLRVSVLQTKSWPGGTKKHSWIHSEKSRTQQKVRLVCARQGKRAYSGRAVTFESVNQGLWALHSRGPS